MYQKKLLHSFVNKVYDNCNKVSYLYKNKQNLEITFLKKKNFFSVSQIYWELLIDNFTNPCPSGFISIQTTSENASDSSFKDKILAI